MTNVDDQVPPLDQFPELQHLIDLRAAGWKLLPNLVDGEVVELRGIRVWPQGWADAIRVRDINDVAGLRCDHTGRVAWRREGRLAEVVDGLLTLPHPVTLSPAGRAIR